MTRADTTTTRAPQPVTGAAAIPPQLRLRDVPMILMYHCVADVTEDPHNLCVTPRRFAEQMAWLARHGLRGVSMRTLTGQMRAGRARKLVGITFDDGYRAVVRNALPELARHGFSATVFVISGLIGGTNEWDEGPSWPLLDAGEVRGLAEAGIEIASHSATHPRLAGVSPARLSAEIAGSRAALADVIGSDVRGFAYPYGSMDTAARSAVRGAGYDYACAVETPLAELGPAALPRVYVGQQDAAARLAAKRMLYQGYIAVKGGRS